VIDGHPCDDVVGDVVHFSLNQIEDAAVRKRLEAIPTGLTLADADVDALIAAGENAVRTSAQLARFREQLRRPAR
jgi:hypothetical protein